MPKRILLYTEVMLVSTCSPRSYLLLDLLCPTLTGTGGGEGSRRQVAVADLFLGLSVVCIQRRGSLLQDGGVATKSNTMKGNITCAT